MRIRALYAAIATVAGALCFAGPASAQAVTGSLVTLVDSGRFNFNRLERLAAIANQGTYNQLTSDPDGPNGSLQPICDPSLRAPSGACSGETFLVFQNVRELVQNANELLGSGPTQYSLGLDDEGVGFALRWTAAEELSAQGSASTEFANTQTASLMSRITALRFGASGFSVGGVSTNFTDQGRLAANTRPKGGGASADPASDSIATKWGGFLNGSFGWGDRKPTDVEDAFDFDNKDLTLGVDYRFSRQLVLGGIFGYSKQRIDFDSRLSVVDGGIESKGYSLTAYALYEWNGPYISGSLGLQRQSLDTTRVITYPSFNVNTESVYATASGSTDSTTWTATFNAGWPLARKALGLEPYFRAEYRHIGIDGFKEASVNSNRSSANFGQPAGFDFNFDDQSIKFLDAVLGFRLQYAFTPSFGVIQPYFTAELHHNFEDSAYSVRAVYNGAGSSASAFDLPSDKPDADFFTLSAGSSMVLPHGWQGFVQYQTVEGLRYVKNQAITVGVRGEF